MNVEGAVRAGITIGNKVVPVGRHVEFFAEAGAAAARVEQLLQHSPPGQGAFILRATEGSATWGFNVHEAVRGVALSDGPSSSLADDVLRYAYKGERSNSAATARDWSGVFDNRPDLLEGVTDPVVREYASRNPVFRAWL